MRERTWIFGAGEQAINVSTKERLLAGYGRDQRPTEAEQLARQAAKRLGWSIPGPAEQPVARGGH
jgi:hypothetical protein